MDKTHIFRVGQFVVTSEGTGEVLHSGSEGFGDFVTVRLDRGDLYEDFPYAVFSCED